MTLFLRNEWNQDVVDIEIHVSRGRCDLRSVVVISSYSDLLLQHLDRSEEVIEDFSRVSTLGNWFWNIYMEVTPNPSQHDCVEKVKELLMTLANKYNLTYIED